MNKYAKHLAEKPFAYICKRDDYSMYAGKVEIIDKKAYRSVHYVVKSDSGVAVEI